ncbi:GGDEF domain-containing protein [Massilia horti]|nr:GGDEF domain-containing protein [Massilia horti]
MVDMTGHRDHHMLDLSVSAAVQELAAAARVRVLTLASSGGKQLLRPRAVIGAGGQARLEEPYEGAAGEPLAALPELQACLAARAASAARPGPDGGGILWLPLWIGERADTCLEITHPAPLLDATMHTIAGVVSVYRNFQNLLDYSERDSLTGLLNRKTFDDQLARMLQSTDAPEPSLPDRPERRQPHADQRQWLAVIDVDHFKRVNDRFGHLYGDEVLILIANLLQSSFRAHDRVFRFGGEEFVVLLRSSTLENAWKIIERFRTSVEAHHFPQVGQVTVSVGFVALSASEPPVAILGHADQALYYAKANGRNRACHYEQLVAEGLLQAAASNDTVEFF